MATKRIGNVPRVININCHSQKMVVCLKPLERFCLKGFVDTLSIS